MMGRLGRTARWVVPALACLAAFVLAGETSTLAATAPVTPSFAPPVSHAGGHAYGLATGDLRNNGAVDVVLSTEGGVQVFLGDGHGRFAKPVTYATCAGQSYGVVLADLTGNGKLDIATANSCSGNRPYTYSILLGKGDGTFARAHNYPLPGLPGSSSSVAAGMLDSSKRMDLVFAIAAGNQSRQALGVALGNGDGTFGPVRTYPTALSNGGPGGSLQSVALADMNGDGRLDAVTADGCCAGQGAGNGPDVGIWLNTGNGTFAPESVTRFGNTYQSTGTVATANLEGNVNRPPDVVSALEPCDANGGGARTTVFFNNGRGGLSGPDGLPGDPYCVSRVAAADLNGDGLPDLIAVNNYYPAGSKVSGTLSVRVNQGHGKFSQPEFFPLAGVELDRYGGPIAVGDFNCDGRPDIAVGTQTGMSVFINTTRTPAIPDSSCCAVPPSVTSSVQSSVATSLATPACAFSNPLATLVNALAVAGITLLVTFPAQLFNRTFDANHDAIREWWETRFGWLRRMRRRSAAVHVGRRRAVAYVVVALAGALLGAGLDPKFGANALTVALVTGTAIAFATGTVVTGTAGSLFRQHLRKQAQWKLHALPSGLIVAALCVLISRVINFQPGYLYGVLVGVVFAGPLRRNEQGRLVAVTSVAILLASVLAWLLLVPVIAVAPPSVAAFGWALIEDFLAALVTAGLVGLVINLLPLRFLPGEQLALWSRPAWSITFAAACFAFLQIIPRPQSAALQVTSVPFWTTVGLFITFGAASVAFWAFFRRWPPKHVSQVSFP